MKPLRPKSFKVKPNRKPVENTVSITTIRGKRIVFKIMHFDIKSVIYIKGLPPLLK